jgi:hypothetical protein
MGVIESERDCSLIRRNSSSVLALPIETVAEVEVAFGVVWKRHDPAYGGVARTNEARRVGR